jgi:ELWxxDGT repeat protein
MDTSPKLVKDINLGSNSSYPSSLINLNGTLLFSADDGNTGRELWKADDRGNVTQLKDINIGLNSSDPSFQIKVDDTQFFTAQDSSTGRELWKVDDKGNTTRVTDINPGAGNFSIHTLGEINGTVFFNANDGSTGDELWKVDQTGKVTQVADINPGAGSSFIMSPTKVNDTLFFTATDGKTGRELWKVNQTGNATQVADINPGADIQVSVFEFLPTSLTNVNGTLFFKASDRISGIELWKVDQTGKVSQVADINPGAGNSFPIGLTAMSNGSADTYGNNLYFSADDGKTGFELWKVDQTGKVRQVADINPGAGNSILFPYSRFLFANLKAIDGTLFFAARDGSTGFEPWKLDSAGKAVQVADINPGAGNSVTSDFTRTLTKVNDTLFFIAEDGKTGSELWKLDSAGKVSQVADLNPGTGSSFPEQLTVANNTLFFTADDGGTTGRELWKVDETDKAVRVADLNPGTSSSFPNELTVVNNTLFFQANDGIHGEELWQLSLLNEINGDDGNNLLSGTPEGDRIDSKDGNDLIFAKAGDDELFGNGGQDQLYGDEGNDILSGGDGRDLLLGGSGNDVLVGGADADLLIGGTERDIFEYDSVTDSGVGMTDRDLIQDFHHFEGDRLDLSNINSFTFIGESNFGAIGVSEVRYLALGNNVLVQADSNGDGTANLEVFLTGVNSVGVNDFIL